MMEKIAANGYDAKCNTKGQADIFRWVPCPAGKLCEEEEPVTNSSTLLPDSQLTLQIIEPETPEYWYLVLISCHLDENCTWVASKAESKLSYDLWLTNGNPTFQDRDPFRLQFSFDEQDATQMYLLTLVAYTILCGLIYRGKAIQKKHYSPSRLNLLAYIAYLKTAGVALQSLNMLVFASDGEGVFLARLIGEVLRMVGIDLLCLLLLLLARGWAFNNGETITKCFFFSWMFLSAIKFVLFCCNFIFVYDIVHDVDIFISWPGYGMLAIRIIFALWFLLEIRWLIKRERCHEKAVFLAHFGAGFLVWFVYLPGVGVVAHFISVLWRFKIILGIRTLANFAAIASLVHLFWPYSQYKKYFGVDFGHIRTGRTDSNELEDFEKLLFEASDSEGEGDTSPRGRVFNEI
ncbi:unnamed protein product, partial [Mesorhabditis spiculigera]